MCPPGDIGRMARMGGARVLPGARAGASPPRSQPEVHGGTRMRTLPCPAPSTGVCGDAFLCAPRFMSAKHMSCKSKRLRVPSIDPLNRLFEELSHCTQSCTSCGGAAPLRSPDVVCGAPAVDFGRMIMQHGTQPPHVRPAV